MRSQRGPETGRTLPAFLRVDGSWIPAGALIAAHLAFTAFGDRALIPAATLGVATAAAIFVSVELHAIAHAVTERFLTKQVAPRRLFVFGDVVDVSVPASAAKQTIVAAAGPLASLALAAALLLFSVGPGAAADAIRVAVVANVALAVLNLLPGLPLDGGQLLTARRRARGRTRPERIPVVFGKIIGLLAIAGGAYLLFVRTMELDIGAIGSWIVLIGIFVLRESSPPLERRAPVPIPDGTVGDWARPFAGRVNADDPAPASPGPFAVSEDGRLAGVLVRPGDGTKMRARDLMVPWNSELGLRTDAPLAQGLERLARRNAAVVVAVDHKGVVRGVLDEEAVREHLHRGGWR